MPRQLYLSIMIDCPADLFEEAKVALMVEGPWSKLLTDLQAAKVSFDHKIEHMEAPRAAAAKKPRQAKARPEAVRVTTDEAGLVTDIEKAEENLL